MEARLGLNTGLEPPAQTRVPALDLEVPGLLSTATFALG
jgi:hypothetical protein